MIIVSPSKYYDFDSKRVKIEKIRMIQISIYIDLEKNRPLTESINDKKNKEVINEFIVKTITPKDHKTIITDKESGYESIMSKLKLAHQLCTFSLRKKSLGIKN